MTKKKKAENNEALTVAGHEQPSSFAMTLMRGENGHVSLPVKTELANDTAAQEAVVVRVLPQGVRREVLKQLQAEEERRSPAQWALIVAVLTISLTIVWRYFPVPPPPPPPDPPLESRHVIITKPVPKDSEYYQLYKETEDYFKNKLYNKCAAALTPLISQLLDERKQIGDENDRLLFYFFESVCLGPVNEDAKRVAKENFEEIARQNLDEVRWTIMWVELCADKYLNVKKQLSDLRNRKELAKDGGIGLNLDKKKNENTGWIKKVNDCVSSLEKRQKNNDNSKKEMNKIKEDLCRLKFLQASLLTTQWLLEWESEYGGKMKVREDFKNPAIESREKALTICCDMEQSSDGNKRDYYELHRFILETVLQQYDKWYMIKWYRNKFIYWKEKAPYFKDKPDLELKEINKQLNSNNGQ